MGFSNSRTARGGQSAGLEILPLHPERSRSTGGGLNGTTSPLTDGPSTGDPGRPQATVNSDGVVRWYVSPKDGEIAGTMYEAWPVPSHVAHDWKPEYGSVPAWMPSDELVSDNGRDWYPEPRDAA